MTALSGTELSHALLDTVSFGTVLIKVDGFHMEHIENKIGAKIYGLYET